MVVGVLGALSQSNVRRIFSFLIVSHIGFAVMGLGLFTPFGLAGLVFYVIEDMLVLTTLFLVAGLIRTGGGCLTGTPIPAEFAGSRTASDASRPLGVAGCGGGPRDL